MGEFKRHGLSVGIQRMDQRLLLTLSVCGKLTHEDYQVITPMLDAALEGVTQPEVYCLVDVRALDGWELRAAWDDMQLGLKHGAEFKKIAILESSAWMEWGTKIIGWFVSAQVELFSQEDEALRWLSAD